MRVFNLLVDKHIVNPAKSMSLPKDSINLLVDKHIVNQGKKMKPLAFKYLNWLVKENILIIDL
jgi:hypothetical protein